MKKKMLNIISQLENGVITYEQARQRVLDLFVVIGNKRKLKPKKECESFLETWDGVIKNIKFNKHANRT